MNMAMTYPTGLGLFLLCTASILHFTSEVQIIQFKPVVAGSSLFSKQLIFTYVNINLGLIFISSFRFTINSMGLYE